MISIQVREKDAAPGRAQADEAQLKIDAQGDELQLWFQTRRYPVEAVIVLDRAEIRAFMAALRCERRAVTKRG